MVNNFITIYIKKNDTTRYYYIHKKNDTSRYYIYIKKNDTTRYYI
jgi:hypothetical protein